MKIKNSEIYNYGVKLAHFQPDIKLPVKINFFLQKNIQVLTQAAQEIENAKVEIGKQFGTLNEETKNYSISPENIEKASNELNDLFNLEQELPIHIFKVDDFDNCELTYSQLSMIIFMIEE